jgi:hypothetical protein
VRTEDRDWRDISYSNVTQLPFQNPDLLELVPVVTVVLLLALLYYRYYCL